MRRLVVIGVVAAALLMACSGEQAVEPEGDPQPEMMTSVSTAPELPPSPEPVAEAVCPYLETDFVARANGQRVAQVQISSDEPYPACFFYRPDGEQQLDVRVYTGVPEVATALVDAAAPVNTSNPANAPAGWKGGYQSTDDGAVYAVARDGDAVIVTTNQKQSVKARSVAEEVISGLGA